MDGLTWDGVRAAERTFEGIASRWRDLGRAAGSVDIGARRIDMPPGGRATPPHAHAAEEEVFLVLSGSGTLWLAGETSPLAAGDAICFAPGARAHTVIAGADGMDVLAFGERRTAELCHLPRAGMGWLGARWVDVPGDRHPFGADEAAGLDVPPHGPRPRCVASLADVAPVATADGLVDRVVRDLGAATGARATTLLHVTVAPGARDAEPHCHAADEELVVVLDGGGAELVGDDERPVGPGSILHRASGEGIGRALRAGPDGLVLLEYRTRRPWDIVAFPERGTIAIPGLGIAGRLVAEADAPTGV